ncbi:hypothetical protein PHYPSEUDO_001087 [Phytophthora pseudosyringae]|uniref:Uncharacterized protein n=1 Tax=Phytophthora pseudosyringae TaxID=221518 RepID=A0A8T1V5T2_9STRA|nr:hypothetical protein PHYPSEUDO_001087 [Phytophthora pseudosyringae]
MVGSGDEGSPSVRNVSESLRTTRGSKARRRVNFNGEDQDDTFASQLQRDAVAASVLLEEEGLPRRHAAAVTGKPCGSTEKQKVIPNAPLDMLPEHEDSIDRLLGMNTIVPDADGAFFGDFPTRWYSWNRFHEQFDLFTANTYQRFVVRSTTSVAKRNRQKSAASKKRDTAKQYDTSMKKRNATMKKATSTRKMSTRNSAATAVRVLDADVENDSKLRAIDSKASTQDTNSGLLPTDWKVYSKTLKCTHGAVRAARIGES